MQNRVAMTAYTNHERQRSRPLNQPFSSLVPLGLSELDHMCTIQMHVKCASAQVDRNRQARKSLFDGQRGKRIQTPPRKAQAGTRYVP